MGNSFKKRELTLEKVLYIFEYGDLTRMDEIDKWLSAAQRKGKLFRVSGDIAGELQTRFSSSDGALLIALTQLPYFNLIASIYFKYCNCDFLQDDPLFLQMCAMLSCRMCHQNTRNSFAGYYVGAFTTIVHCLCSR